MPNFTKFQKLKIRNSQYGFTLIELLVAIGIVAMVFGVIIGSATQIQRSGRDGKRQSDLRNIQGALQQFYADQNYYPNNIDISTLDSLKSPDNSKTYLKSVPKDPNITSKYCYIAYTSQPGSSGNTSNCDNSAPNKCYYYRLFATMENSGATAFAQSYCSVATYNYELNPN